MFYFLLEDMVGCIANMNKNIRKKILNQKDFFCC